MIEKNDKVKIQDNFLPKEEFVTLRDTLLGLHFPWYFNTIIVDAAFKIEDLEKYFDINIDLQDEDEIDSVGGMMFFIANKVPKNNQVYKYKNSLQFKVIKASAR